MVLPQVKNGDVFEIQSDNGYGYFQCVKESPANEVEIIRILPGRFDDNLETAKIDELVNKKELYFIQFPLKYGIKKKVIKKIGNYPVPQNVRVPRFYRDEYVVNGEFIAWHIIDSETYRRHSVKKLTEEQKKLSPWGIWNDTLLAERIAEGWNLEDWI